MSKTVLLRNSDGTSRGHLELSSGRVMGEAGETLERLTPTEDYDCALADLASSMVYQRHARMTGEPVVVRDADGDDRLYTKDLGIADVHTDSAIPNYAAGYRLADGVADIAMPPIVVSKASNKYNTWDAPNAFRRVLPNGSAPGGQVPEVNPTLSSASYSTVEYALGAYIPTEVDANADAPLRPLQAATARIMNALMLEREIRVATLLKTAGSWDSSLVTAIAAAAKWNGGASSDPVKDLHTIIESSYMPVTGIVLSELVMHDFVRNPNVQKYITYKDSAGPIPKASAIASLLELPPIYVAKMKYFASGTTMSYVWGNDVVLLHQPGNMMPTSQDEVATASTFRWNGGGDGTTSNGFLVRSFFDQKRGGRGGNTVVIVHNDAEVMTSKYVGGLLTSAHG